MPHCFSCKKEEALLASTVTIELALMFFQFFNGCFYLGATSLSNIFIIIRCFILHFLSIYLGWYWHSHFSSLFCLCLQDISFFFQSFFTVTSSVSLNLTKSSYRCSVIVTYCLKYILPILDLGLGCLVHLHSMWLLLTKVPYYHLFSVSCSLSLCFSITDLFCIRYFLICYLIYLSTTLFFKLFS